MRQAYAERCADTVAKKAKGKGTAAKAKPRKAAVAMKAMKAMKKVGQPCPTYNMEWSRERVIGRFGPEDASKLFSWKGTGKNGVEAAIAEAKRWVHASCRTLGYAVPAKCK